MKFDSQNKTKVFNWIRSGCNYKHGVLLYSEIGRNESLKRLFPGKQHRYSRKLMYELCKSAGIDWSKINEPIKPSHAKMPTPVITVGEKEQKGFTSNVTGYPRVMRRVIMEYAELFQERSKAHTLMVYMPESNAETVKQKRKELFDMIKACTVRLEQLYAAREGYEKNGALPAEDQLWQKPKSIPKLPDDIDDLKKMKKNLQTANTKDQTTLDYQAKKKMEKKTPLPAGPKRVKLENRIKTRIKKIEDIDYKLNQLQI